MHIVQIVVGYVLIILGAAIELLGFLAQTGFIKPHPTKTLMEAGQWDVVKAIVSKLPWWAILGLVLIYAGLKMVGVELPF